MYHIVYLTTNLVNLKMYVGIHSTYNLNDGYLGSGRTLLKAIKKYGKENFERKILYFCLTREDAAKIEESIVDLNFVTSKNTYNLRLGGGNEGLMTEESKYKLSESLKSLHKSPDYINPHIGMKRSEETKRKMSIKNKRSFKEKYGENYKVMIDKCCKKFGGENGFFGKSHTEETKKILSDKKSILYKIISPDGNIIEFKGVLRDFCSEHKLSFSCLYRNINKGTIQETKHMNRTVENKNCIGWEITKVDQFQL